jgi:hypothetical protein
MPHLGIEPVAEESWATREAKVWVLMFWVLMAWVPIRGATCTTAAPDRRVPRPPAPGTTMGRHPPRPTPGPLPRGSPQGRPGAGDPETRCAEPVTSPGRSGRIDTTFVAVPRKRPGEKKKTTAARAEPEYEPNLSPNTS